MLNKLIAVRNIQQITHDNYCQGIHAHIDTRVSTYVKVTAKEACSKDVP